MILLIKPPIQRKHLYIKLKCPVCRKWFWKLKSKIGIKSKKRFCSRKCKDVGQQMDVGIIKVGFYKGKSYRKRAFVKHGCKCTNCKEKNEKMLDVHHINENRKDNRLKNLIVLCVWCHAMVTRGLVKIVKRKFVRVRREG